MNKTDNYPVVLCDMRNVLDFIDIQHMLTRSKPGRK